MSRDVGDVLLVLRRAAGITQEELASDLGITQAALSRYENGLRDPDHAMTERLSAALGVTAEFLRHEFRMHGAIAADAHMRRQKTAKPSDWKRVEARLNAARMQTTYLLERVPLRPQNHVIHVDPDDRSPYEAAAMLRAAWRMPLGPVRDLTRWIESAGVIVLDEDLGTHRIDGMSQWAGDHAVIILNSAAPTDRRRLTLAHELGHLVMHASHVDPDAEAQADEFAAEFLMPETMIRPELTNLTLGKLADLKAEWGVSMQAVVERAHRLGRTSPEERTRFYRQLSSRGWKTREPGSDELPPEIPRLAPSIGRRLHESELTRPEVMKLLGAREGADNPFDPPKRVLRAV
ncbi:Zn-dependent peptidase ImmA (M78 family) [Clavibacter michiganensis]|uniref:helix-turn-helix domain-containing protein n=1 Tax=Clavibacter michiganensis TaxID=28447 RepID=UPI00195908BD|nr:XRE family transcriptional regulator [Clavibacter michiganensis]MBM7411136.1 Zn-dependent peptidase ImmA (M78 family) [Clavibacter michiganensis]